MDSGGDGYDSNGKSVHSSGNKRNSDLKTARNQYSPVSEESKRKHPWTARKNYCMKKINRVFKNQTQDSVVTSSGLRNHKAESLHKREIQAETYNTDGENLTYETPSTIVKTTYNNVLFSYQSTQSEGDHNLPIYRIPSTSCLNDALTPVNRISQHQNYNKGADNSFSSLTEKSEFSKMPAESYIPQNFHAISNPDTMITNSTFSSHETYSETDILPGTQKRQEIDHKSINSLYIEHNLESSAATCQGELSNIESNKDARAPIENSSTTDLITQSEDTFNHNSTFESLNLVEMFQSSSAPPTQNTFSGKSSLRNCELDSSVSRDKHKKQPDDQFTFNHSNMFENLNLVEMCQSSSASLTQNTFSGKSSLRNCEFDNSFGHDNHKKEPDVSSQARTLLKPASNHCSALLSISTNLDDSVIKKRYSALQFEGAKSTADFNSGVSKSLQNQNTVQNEPTDIKRALPKNYGLENPEIESIISNQYIFTSKEKLKNENLDITSINNLEDSVNKKHDSALQFGKAKPTTDFNSRVSTRLLNPNTFQNKHTSISQLENPEIESTISNQSIFTSKGKLQNENFFITKARFYACVLKSLPKDQFIEVEKEISVILVNSQVSAAIDLDKSQALSMWHDNQLPSIFKKNWNIEPDIFDTKALFYINILMNLSKEKFEEVDKNISCILLQAQKALWEKSQGNFHSEYARQPVFDYWEIASQNQGLPSPMQKKDASNFIQSPEKKQLYPSLSDVEFNGDINEQDSEDDSDLEHRRVTSRQENEECTDDDDASKEKILNDQLPYKPPKKNTTTPVRQWTSQRISKPLKDKAVPKPSTSYKYVLKFVYALAVLLCAIAAAFFGVTYWPKTFEGFSKTNLSPQPVVDIIKNLQKEFGEQPPMTFNIISAALRKVTEPEPKAPAIILLLAEQGAEDIAGRFARKIADSVSSANNMVVVPSYAYDTKDHDEAKKDIDDLLMENLSLDRLEVVLVERLDNIPPDVAAIFHTYCDHENASFKRVVYLMTIASTKTQLNSLTTKDWDVIAGEHLSEAWIKGGNDQVSSLLSRLTVSVAAIVPRG